MLTTAQAADMTGIPRRTIQWACKQGDLPAQPIGHRIWLIGEADLLVWAAKRRKGDAR